MKRTVALLLAAMMCFALLAACTGSSTPTPAPTPTPAQATPAANTPAPDTPTPAPATEAPTPTAPPETERNILNVKIGGDFRVQPNDCEFGVYLQDRFGIIIETVDTSEQDIIKMLAAANNLPDVFGVTIQDNFAVQLREDGMIREIGNAILDKYPNVKSIITTKAVNNRDLFAATGKAYFLPTINDPDLGLEPFHHTFQYRKDWADAAGVKHPATTIDEFADMLRAFTFGDPNGDGSVTYGYTGWIYGPWFYPFTNYDHWMYEDGSWVYGPFSKGAREALVWINGLFKEGVIDPEFANANSLDLLTTDRVGVRLARWDEYGIERQAVKTWGPAHEALTGGDDLNALDFIGWTPPLAKDANTKPGWSAYTNDPYGKAYSIRVSDELMDRLMEIAEWYADPSSDGRWITQFGFEGKDYYMDNGMAYRTLPDDASQLYEVYEFIGIGQTLGPAWGYGTWLNQYDANPTYDIRIRESVKERAAAYAPYVYTFWNEVNIVSTPAKDELPLGDFEDVFMGIIATQGDAGREWDEYIDRLKSIYGLQDAYDQVNALFGAP